MPEPQEQAPSWTLPRMPDGKPLPPIETRFTAGRSGNPGGRRKGASIVHEIERRLAQGAKFDENGELVQAGTEACEIAATLIDVSRGQLDPKSIDVKAALAIMERVDGAVVKERVNTNIEVLQDVELRDRRERPAPGTETKA